MGFWFLAVCLSLIKLFPLFWSFWLDEAIQWQVSPNLDYYLSNFAVKDFNPPLFYLLTHLWQKLLPDYLEIDYILRLLPLSLSLILFLSFYRLLKHRLSYQSLRVSFLLLLSSPLIVYYSVEYRAYIFTVLIAFWLWWFWRWRIIEAEEFKFSFLIFILLLILALLTHYSLVFFVLAMFLITLYQKRSWWVLLLWLTAFGLAGIIWERIFIAQWQNSQLVLTTLPHWTDILGSALNLRSWLFIVVKFVLGRISFYPKSLFYLSGVGLAAPFWLLFLRGGRQDRLSLWLFVVTLTAALIYGFFGFGFSYFRYIYLLPIFAYLIALGLQGLRYKKLILVYLLVVQVMAVIILILYPRFYKEDWRALTAYLNQQDQPAALVLPRSALAPLVFYRLGSNYRIYDVSQVNKVDLNQVYLVDYAKLIFNPTNQVQKDLNRHGYQFIQRISFDGLGLTLDYYQKIRMVK